MSEMVQAFSHTVSLLLPHADGPSDLRGLPAAERETLQHSNSGVSRVTCGPCFPTGRSMRSVMVSRALENPAVEVQKFIYSKLLTNHHSRGLTFAINVCKHVGWSEYPLCSLLQKTIKIFVSFMTSSVLSIVLL